MNKRTVQTSQTEFKLDLDLLWYNVKAINSGARQYRRQGITTAYLYLMLGEYHLGRRDGIYYYLAYNHVMAVDVQRKFMDMIAGEETSSIVSSRRGQIKLDNGQVFNFVGLDGINGDIFRGTNRDRYRFFDDVPPDLCSKSMYIAVMLILKLANIEVI